MCVDKIKRLESFKKFEICQKLHLTYSTYVDIVWNSNFAPFCSEIDQCDAREREGVTQKNAASVNWRRFVPSGSIVSLLITLHCASRNSHFSDCTTYSLLYDDFVVLLYLRLLCTKCQTWAVATGTKQRNMHCPIFHRLVTTTAFSYSAGQNQTFCLIQDEELVPNEC